MKYIYDNRVDELKEMKIYLMNLNYHHEFPLVPLDTKLTPLILACYLGKQIKHNY